MTTRWTIGIDWDRDGNYTDETPRVLSAQRRWPRRLVGMSSAGWRRDGGLAGNFAQLSGFVKPLSLPTFCSS